MVTIEKETYLIASEAARHLKISRVTFYKRYRQALKQFTVGQLRWPHYRLSDVEELSKVKAVN